VQLDPRNTDALYNLSVTLARDGQIADARPYLERFLKTAPAAGNERERREVSDLLTNGRRGSP